MKLSIFALLSLLSTRSSACPYAKSNDTKPDDEVHGSLRNRRLSSLKGDATTRKSISDRINKRRLETNSRSLQTSQCVSRDTYNNIVEDIEGISQDIGNLGERGHFLGGIVRLAAHDFMDYDLNAENSATSQALGSDGCLDFSHDANAGLSDLWCDDSEACPLKHLYDTNYSFMSKADFWVAAANAVVQITSISSNARPNGLILPFRWGRIDQASCGESSERLPEPTGCSAVEATFIERMGLTWRDAVALMGAHTLGRGDENFSGHDGTWVDSDEESTIFDKRFYEEVERRSWRPRQTDASGVNWTWGGQNRGVMMLNTDICLSFDIPDGNNQDCCTDTTGNCRGFNNQCNTAANVRPDAFGAFEEFKNFGNNNNEPFYEAFSIAWKLATENGYSENELFDVPETCDPSAPTPAEPSRAPNTSPVVQPSPPTAPSPTPNCLPKNEQCESNNECCSGKCKNGKCKKRNDPAPSPTPNCLPRNEQCGSNNECCSRRCKNGKCKNNRNKTRRSLFEKSM